MAIKQPHWLAAGLTASTTTLYCQPMATVGPGTSVFSAEANHPFQMDVGGTVRNLRVRLSAAPGSGNSRTFTLRKNGVDQTVTVTLADSDTDVSDTTHSFSVAAGDTLVVKSASTGSTACVMSAVWELETADDYLSTYAVGTPDSITSTTNYAPLFSAGAWSTTAAQGTAVAPIAGTISSYRIQLATAPGAAASGKSRTFVLEKNGVAQDGSGGTPNTTITISETATTGAASGFSLAITALDLVRCKMTAANAPAASRVCGAHDFTASTSGEMAFSATPNDAPSASTSEWNFGVGGSPVWITTEANAELPGPITAISLNGLYVTLDAALLSSVSHTYYLRKNGARTAQMVYVLGSGTTAGPAGGAAVSIGSSDRFAIEADVRGATSSTNRPHLAFALGTAPFAAATTRVTQAVVEVLSFPTPDVRVSQLVVETLQPTLQPYLGTLAVTLDALTVTGTGTVTGAPITGTLAVTLDALTVAATGTVETVITGTLAVTLDALTCVATGTVTSVAMTVDQYALEYAIDLLQTVVVYPGPGPSVCGRDQVMTWIETTSDVI